MTSSSYVSHILNSAMSQDCYSTSTSASMPSPQAPARGLGLYSMPEAPQSTLATTMMHSPESEPCWSSASSMEPEYVPSQPPDIFSAAFDPFSSLPPAAATGAASPEAPPLEFCATPPSSGASHMHSHRGSVSSYAASDASEGAAYTPRVKPEDAAEWYQAAGSEHVLHRGGASQGPSMYTPATLAPHTEDLYGPMPEWSKAEAASHVGYLSATTPDPRTASFARFDMSAVLPSVRIKKKRQRTRPEEATHDCRICGKLFKRSYNWKSHMETHNPDRKYPHPCTAMVGDQKCAKKFQRKTDLDRHFDSVCLSTSRRSNASANHCSL